MFKARHFGFGLGFVAALGAASPGQAAIANLGGGPATNTATECAASNWTWGIAAGAEGGAAVNRCTNFMEFPSSPAGAAINPQTGQPFNMNPLGAGQKDLVFTLQHTVAPHPGAPFNEIAPIPNPAAEVYAGRFTSAVSGVVVQKAGAAVFPHGT